MNPPRPSIRQLECAVAVADSLHFGRAAGSCAITQRALSAQVLQMVANGLGVTLLPERALAVELRPNAGLAVRPFRSPAPSRTIGLAWRPRAARAGEYRLLGQAFALELGRARKR